MEYRFSKDLIATADQEILFYSSSVFDPPDNLDPAAYPSQARSVLRRAVSTMGDNNMLNPIAGYWSSFMFHTVLRRGTTETTNDLVDLCTRPFTASDKTAPLASRAAQDYRTYTDTPMNSIVLISTIASAELTFSDGDYQYSNPSYTGSIRHTFSCGVQYGNGSIASAVSRQLYTNVVPMIGTYSAQSKYTIPSDACLMAIGLTYPTRNVTDALLKITSGKANLVPYSQSSVVAQTVNIDTFLMYDKTTGLFKKYGREYFTNQNVYYTPGGRYGISLQVRYNHKQVKL